MDHLVNLVNPVSPVKMTFVAFAGKVFSQDYMIIRINMIFCAEP